MTNKDISKEEKLNLVAARIRGVKVDKFNAELNLVEQNALAALNVADRAYVLESGSIKMSGKAKDLISNDEVTKAYLGG